MAGRGTAGAWVLVLSLWGEPLPPLPPPLWKALPPPQNFPGTWALPFQLPCPPCASPLSPISLWPLHLGAVSQGQR